MTDQDAKCYQCGKAFRRTERRVLVRMLTEDQTVYVGATCAKSIAKRGTIELASGVFVAAEICDCQNPEPPHGVALVSNECPIHNLRSHS